MPFRRNWLHSVLVWWSYITSAFMMSLPDTPKVCSSPLISRPYTMAEKQSGHHVTATGTPPTTSLTISCLLNILTEYALLSPLMESPSTCSSALRVESSRAVLIPETIHDTSRYANNRAELSHEPTRVWERGMRKFKSIEQAQRFLGAHAAVYNLFNLGRHLVSAENYRYFRLRAFASWDKAVAM